VEGPTLVRRQLGRRLRALREKARKTAADVEYVASRSKLWRIEEGKSPVRVADVKELARIYGADDTTIDALAALALGTSGRGWWEDFGDVLPYDFRLYIDLEASADEVKTFSPDVVDGLLQTPDYARAVELGSNLDGSTSTVDRVVALRMQRQEVVLGTARPGRVVAVLGAGALARQVGSRRIMAEQIRHLRGLAGRVEIRVLPWSAGAHPAMIGQFTIFEFESPDDPSVLYLETYVGARYVDTAPQVDRQRAIFDWIHDRSEPLEEHTP
jgi:transcriptional regulator with XRE-family HTH domain